MTEVFAALVPLIICFTALFAMLRGVDVFQAAVEGAGEGIKMAVKIFPALVVLLTAVSMLRASGLTDMFTRLAAPILTSLGIAPETAPLILLRPISGSAALAVGSEIIQNAGVDSEAGRMAAVMLGSTETTFYVIAVYFAAADVKKMRYAVPAALMADAAAFIAAAVSTRLLF